MCTKDFETSRAPDDSEDGQGEDLSLHSACHPCDSMPGVVRHADVAENRLCMLFITGDNVETILHSTSPNGSWIVWPQKTSRR